MTLLGAAAGVLLSRMPKPDTLEMDVSRHSRTWLGYRVGVGVGVGVGLGLGVGLEQALENLVRA